MENSNLIDENGKYKDKASIAEIAKVWDGKSAQYKCSQILNELMQARFDYCLPEDVDNEIEAITLEGNKIYSNDIRDYMMIIQSYIRERLIYEAFNEPLEKIGYKNVLSNITSIKKIAKGTLIWKELNPIAKQQGLNIFPLYNLNQHPAKEPSICEGVDF